MAIKVKEINGVKSSLVKQVNGQRRVKIGSVGSGGGVPLSTPASMWIMWWANRLVYTTSSHYPNAPKEFAPSGTWYSYDTGAGWDLTPDAFGESHDGDPVFATTRYNDGFREFMHASASQIFAQTTKGYGSAPWNTEWLGDSNKQWQNRVAYNHHDQVWVTSRSNTNVNSLYVSSGNAGQTNNVMGWLAVPNLQSGDTQTSRIEYCGKYDGNKRKWAVLAGARFFINTGSTSGSVADDEQWIKMTNNLGFSPQEFCYGDTGEEHGRFVVCGTSDQFRYSTDNGETWTAASSVTHADGTPHGTSFVNVTYNPRTDMWIAVANNSTIASSSDGGVNWVAKHHGNNHYYWVETDGFNTVAAGKDSLLMISSSSADAGRTPSCVWVTASVRDLPSTADCSRPFTCNVLRPL